MAADQIKATEPLSPASLRALADRMWDDSPKQAILEIVARYEELVEWVGPCFNYDEAPIPS
jgi:hypothetical protein